MKNFILLNEGSDPDWHKNTSEADTASQIREWGKWMSMLSEKGQLVSGGDLLYPHGTRLNSAGVATDIAASEYKDLIRGYSIISASDMAQAVEIAKTCPVFSDKDVVVQIREILAME